ncbi:MAG: 50S ribosomal protein L25 [Bacteroidales bacterium]|nr:50S ribosomal protein L25 [Bacteroidales bacterium]
MKHFELKGQLRQTGNKATIKAIREQGLVPCNLYGLGMQNILFTVNEKELNALICNPASFIIDLVLGEDKYTAIVHELQFHPVQDNCLHVDFLAVNEEKPIAINVPLNITGHAAGVQLGGKFVKNVRELRICALMKDLPDQLDIDITELGIGQNIVAGDLHFENVTILSPKNTIICGVKATRQSAQS